MVGGSVKGARGGHTFQKPLARLCLFQKNISTYPTWSAALPAAIVEQDLTLQRPSICSLVCFHLGSHPVTAVPRSFFSPVLSLGPVPAGTKLIKLYKGRN